MRSGLGTVVTGLATILLVSAAPGQDAGNANDAKPKEMKQRCQMMMQRMQEMKQQTAEMNEKLEQHLKTMQGAQGEAKTDAMAQVVELLAQQRLQMHERHSQMMQNMMGHMGEHMADGDGMMQCPMMKKMQSDPAQKQSGQDHEAHH